MVREEGPVEVTLRPESERYDSRHEGWRRQVDGLYTELFGKATQVSSTPGPRSHEESQAGRHKGFAETVVLVIGSVPVASSVANIIMEWLGRDRGRWAQVEIEAGGQITRITVHGDPVSDKTLREALLRSFGTEGGHEGA